MKKLTTMGSVAAVLSVVVAIFVFHAPSHAIPLAPGLESRHDVSIELLKKNEFRKVVELEERISLDDPRDLTAYFLLTMAYLNLDNERMALRQAERAMKVDGLFASEIYGVMGRYYSGRKRYHKSLVYFLESLKIKEDPAVIRQVASIYLGQGLLKNARAYYEKLLATNPDYLNLSRIHLAEGDYAKSAEYAEKAIEDDARSSGAYLVLGTCYLLTDRPEEAESRFEALSELNPEFHMTSYFIGLTRLVRKDYEGAAQNFRKIIARSPELKEPYLNAAAAMHLLGDYKGAKEAATKAIEVDPLDDAGHLILGAVLLSEGKPGEADIEFLKAGDIFPDLSRADFRMSEHVRSAPAELPARLSLSYVLMRAGLHIQAIEAVDSMLLVHKEESPFFTITRARAEARLGNIAEAEETYLSAIEKHPGLITHYVELGEVLESKGDYDRAALYYRKAQKIEPGSYRLSMILADLYEKASRFDDAVSEYRKAVASSPQTAAGYSRLSGALIKKGEMEPALKYALKGVEANPEDAEAREALAWAYFKLGRFEDALTVYSALVRAGTEKPTVYYRLGLVQRKLDKAKEAKESLERALDLSDGFAEAEDAKAVLRDLSGLG